MHLTKTVSQATLYAALCLGATMASAQSLSPDAIRSVKPAELGGLRVHDQALPVSAEAFQDEDGNPLVLADLQGQISVVNFWATWCAPCRAEMPSLMELQQSLGDDSFEVVTIATGRNPISAINRFFDAEGLTDLPKHRDPTMGFAQSMSVLGLPVTVILDRNSQEIARIQGEANWSSPDVIAFFQALKDQSS